MSRESGISPKDFAIGVLSVTAVILLATLLTINAFVPRQAFAASQAASSGNYVACASQLEETSEVLFIVNSEQRIMNAYVFNVGTGQVDLIQQIDIERIAKDVQRGGKEGQGPGMFRGPGARPRR